MDSEKKNNYENRNFLIMPYTNKWYKLIVAVPTGKTTQEICENVYRRICNVYIRPNIAIAIMDLQTRQAFVFTSMHELNGNLISVSCNKFEQFDNAN